MLKLLCLILLNSLKAEWAFGRHIIKPQYSYQQPNYLPYTDYIYHNPQAYAQNYQQFPMYTPTGTYFDQRRGVLRPFPGGGVPVLVDYHKRCSNHFVGLKAHPKEQQYYYVCKPDCVIFGKCQNLQIFNSTNGQCVQHPPPEYMPSCTAVGRFPLFSDCHLYYKCDEDLKAKIYSCPPHMIFSPASQKCISGNKCTPTQISPQSSYIPEYCANKFPPCYENGLFRSPSDCSLYYSCALQKNGVYLQTRLRCPNGFFYDLKRSKCLPAEQVYCDCIQVAELVYPKANGLPLQPAIYPAQFNLDSLEENVYPIEHTKEEISFNKCHNVSEKEASEVKEDISPASPEDVEKTTINSEEITSTEVYRLTTTTEALEVTESKTSIIETKITANDKIQTDLKLDQLESMALILEESTKSSTDVPTEELTNVFQETTHGKISDLDMQTTTTSVIIEPETHLLTSTVPPFPCVETNRKESGDDKSGANDTLTAQLQTKACFTSSSSQNTIKLPDTDKQSNAKTLVSAFTRGSRSALLKQKITPHTTLITHETLTNLKPEKADNIEQNENRENIEFEKKAANPHSKENAENDLKTENILDSERNNKITPETILTTSKSLQNFAQTIRTIENNSEHNVTEKDLLDVKSKNDSNTVLKETTIKIDVSKNISIEKPLEHNSITAGLNSNTTLENFENFSNTLLHEEEPTNLNSDTFPENEAIKSSIFSKEEFLPVHGKALDLAERPEQTIDFDYITDNPAENSNSDINLDYDFTTIISEIENTHESEPGRIAAIEFEKNLDSTEEDIRNKDAIAIKPPLNMTLAVKPVTITEITTTKKNENEEDNYASNEVNIFETHSAKTVSSPTIDSTSLISHTLNISSSCTQMPTTTLEYIPYTIFTNECCVKQAYPLQLQVSEQQLQEETQDSNKGKKLYYVLRIKPVNKMLTAPNINNNNNNTVTETSYPQMYNGNIPRLEIIAERPIEVHFKICPSNCNKSHEHNVSPAGNPAVFVRWFENKSNQTLGFETANEVNSLSDGGINCC